MAQRWVMISVRLPGVSASTFPAHALEINTSNTERAARPSWNLALAVDFVSVEQWSMRAALAS